METPHPLLRSFGRTKSRTLKPSAARRLETLLPTIALPQAPFAPATLSPGARETWLEIGFGGGEHLAGQAARHPDVLLLGVEPFVNGVASALAHIEREALANVRLHMGDAREVLERLPEASLARIFILFPDPWPKARQHKRRLIQPEVVDALARVLAPGGRLRFATDWADYADWTLERFRASPAFRWTAERADDWRVAPQDHVPTRYQEKRLGDCGPIWLEFERVA